MISAVIITYNEAVKLKKCLKSIEKFVDEIVVIDLGSKDNTHEILSLFNVRLFTHKLLPYADPIRNLAISKARGNWILMLDPDEVIKPTLVEKLKKVIDNHSDYVAVNIPFKNIFFGRWIKHTNFWPDRHIRFFRKDKVRWLDSVHSYPLVDGKILDLPAEESNAIDHYGYDNIWQFIEKQNRYSTIEANNRLSVGEHFSPFLLLWGPIREFLVRCIKHRGYKDGIYGFFIVLILMFYRIQVQVKILLISIKKMLSA